MTLGQRVERLMVQRGLTQAELARRVGVSQPSIYGLIRKNKLGSRHLHKVARELGTTPAYLAGETSDPSSDLPDDVLTAEERGCVDQLRRLTPKDRAAVLQLLDTLSNCGEPEPPPRPTLHEPKLEYRAG